MKKNKYNYENIFSYYEGEEGGEGKGGKADDKPKTFTQEDVDKIVGKERATFNKQKETLVKQLEEHKTKYAEGTVERENLQKQVDELRSTYETEADKNKRMLKEQTEKFTNETASLVKDRDQWKIRYTESRIARELTDAALAHDAISAEDIVLALRGSTDLTPINDDDNKPTGDFDVKVKFSVKDEDGKTKNLVLSPAEAVKRMKENTQRYGHYFKSGQSGGAGGSNTSAGSDNGELRLTENMTPEQYKKWRQTHASELR